MVMSLYMKTTDFRTFERQGSDLVTVRVQQKDLRCPKCDTAYGPKEYEPIVTPNGHHICACCLATINKYQLRDVYAHGSQHFRTDYYRMDVSNLARSNHQNLQSDYISLFEILEEIGTGGQGTVFKCRHKWDRTMYAIKKIRHGWQTQKQEIIHLSKLTHQNVVRYINAWVENDYTYPAMREAYDRMDERQKREQRIENRLCTLLSTDQRREQEDRDESLNKHIVTDMIDRPPPETFSQAAYLYIQMELCEFSLRDLIGTIHHDRPRMWSILGQIMKGLAYIHDEGIIHLDLKPGNILIGFGDRAKIADFGVARPDNSQSDGDVFMPGYRGTRDYMAPEVRTRGPAKYTTQADMYSLGVVISEMTTGNRKQGLELVKQVKNDEEMDFDPSLLDNYLQEIIVIAHLTQDNPDSRPTSSEMYRVVKNIIKNVLDVRDSNVQKLKWTVILSDIVSSPMIESDNAEARTLYFMNSSGNIIRYDSLLWKQMPEMTVAGWDKEFLCYVDDEYLYTVLVTQTCMDGYGDREVFVDTPDHDGWYSYLVRRSIIGEDHSARYHQFLDYSTYIGIQFFMRRTSAMDLLLYVLTANCELRTDLAMYSIHSSSEKMSIEWTHVTNIPHSLPSSDHFTVSSGGDVYIYDIDDRTICVYDERGERIDEIDCGSWLSYDELTTLCTDKENRLYVLYRLAEFGPCVYIYERYPSEGIYPAKQMTFQSLPQAVKGMMVRRNGDIIIETATQLFVYDGQSDDFQSDFESDDNNASPDAEQGKDDFCATEDELEESSSWE